MPSMNQLYRALSSTYTTRTMIEEIQRTNTLFRGSPVYATQPATGSILGVPGVGKTSTIRRTLSLLPQVIAHEEFGGKPFFCKQVLYLMVECPSDCSVKTLGLNIAVAIDKAIGSSYARQLTSLRSAAASAIATQVKILCLTHHVGLILIDEIQNAVTTAQKNKQIKPLIKFLVELTNDTCTAAFFVGTPIAEELFTSQEHLKRRTRGIRLLPFKPDGSYRAFLQAIWPYQFTSAMAPLTEQMANKLYDYSGGIPAYIIKIFQETQAQPLLQGRAASPPRRCSGLSTSWSSRCLVPSLGAPIFLTSYPLRRAKPHQCLYPQTPPLRSSASMRTLGAGRQPHVRKQI